MPSTRYIRLKIGDNEVNVNSFEDLPIAISYSLEDSEDFQNKESSISLDINIPANLNNDFASNTFRNPSIEDLTNGQIFKSWQAAVLESNSIELLVGKAFLKDASHSYKPIDYTYNITGDNADWIVLLNDNTIYDFIKHINFTFSKTEIQNSWNFDGRNESLPYVFAPVRYRLPFNGYTIDTISNQSVPDDTKIAANYLRPSISKYFILYWAFKSIGYKIAPGGFTDTDYFRRQVMPWTFGGFLDSEGTQLDKHKFLAKSTSDKYFDTDRGKRLDDYLDLNVANDFEKGGFDNNNDYSYNAITREMIWQYKTPDFGPLNAAFSMVVYYKASLSGSQSNLTVVTEWFVNGIKYQSDVIVTEGSGFIGTVRPIGQTEVFFKTGDYGINVNVGDVVSAKVHIHLYKDKHAINDVAEVTLNVLEFKLDFFRIEIGGSINFNNFTGFQNYKIMDYISGVVDEFDLSVNTDAINKIVYIEPTHAYSLNSSPLPVNDGYFKDDFLDWNSKADLAKTWKLTNFNSVNKEYDFKYKDDSNDGLLKLIQDRNTNILALGKYVFPDRFLTGIKPRENRFFSPTMHYDVTQFKFLGTGLNTGITPQMIAIIPENISNTSQSESANTFNPKSCYYKGNVTGAGAWNFDGDVLQTYPFMFAVNYQPGGENDPILSYSDENINGVIGRGLLKRFFWQRLAIMRNGQRYEPCYFNLNNNDVSNPLHREFIVFDGNKWEIIQIKDYKPLVDDSTELLMYKWTPITQDDFNATYPSVSSLTGTLTGSLDIKYAQLKALYSDIPT